MEKYLSDRNRSHPMQCALYIGSYNILFEHSINNLSEEEIYIIEDAVPNNLMDNNLVIIRKS